MAMIGGAWSYLQLFGGIASRYHTATLFICYCLSSFIHSLSHSFSLLLFTFFYFLFVLVYIVPLGSIPYDSLQLQPSFVYIPRLLRSTILNSLFSLYFLLFSLCLPIVCFIIHLFVFCLMIFALSGRLVILSSHLQRICNTVSQLDVICLT